MPAHLTTEQLAERYGVTPDTARSWLRGKRPKFGYIQIGKEKLVPSVEVLRYEAANLVRGKHSAEMSDTTLLQLIENLKGKL